MFKLVSKISFFSKLLETRFEWKANWLYSHLFSKREVPRSNFVMHNVHCQRKLALCTKCDEPVPRCELAAHNTNFHVTVECPACGHQCEKRHLVDHQVSTKKMWMSSSSMV